MFDVHRKWFIKQKKLMILVLLLRPVHTAHSMRIGSGSMCIDCVHTKRELSQTSFKPVWSQSTSRGGFDLVRSGSPTLSRDYRRGLAEHMMAVGWTLEETRVLVSVCGRQTCKARWMGSLEIVQYSKELQRSWGRLESTRCGNNVVPRLKTWHRNIERYVVI